MSNGIFEFLSNAFIQSPHAMKELEFAYEQNKVIIAVVVDNVEIPNKNIVTISHQNQNFFNELHEQITKLM